MPTAGRLAGAVILALFGWYIGGILVPFFPEERAPDYLLPMCAGLGLFIGWKFCGARAGRGYREAISNGLTSAAALSFCIIAGLSFNSMMSNALRNRYDGPMDAVAGMFELMLEQALAFFDTPLIVTVFVGGVLCALVVEFFGKRYT